MATSNRTQSGDVAVLIQTALDARTEVHGSRTGPTVVADTIAAEIAYDSALIELCGICGIVTDAKRFDPPAIERLRIEGELASIGLDLGSIAGKVARGT